MSPQFSSPPPLKATLPLYAIFVYLVKSFYLPVAKARKSRVRGGAV